MSFHTGLLEITVAVLLANLITAVVVFGTMAVILNRLKESLNESLEDLASNPMMDMLTMGMGGGGGGGSLGPQPGSDPHTTPDSNTNEEDPFGDVDSLFRHDENGDPIDIGDEIRDGPSSDEMFGTDTDNE